MMNDEEELNNNNVDLLIEDLGPSQMELPVELRSMRRRYAPLGQTYVAALRAEVALAAEQMSGRGGCNVTQP